MDLRDNIEAVHEVLVKEGIDNTWEFQRPYGEANATADKIYRLFDVNERRPQIVTDKEYKKSKFTEVYSGSCDIDKLVNCYQDGDFKMWGRGFMYGYGFYFTPKFDVARKTYARDQKRKNMMKAKILPSAKVVTATDYGYMLCTEFPVADQRLPISPKDDFDKKRLIVSNIVNGFEMYSFGALMFGYDALTTTDKEIYNVLNRDITIQTADPTVKSFEKVLQI